MAFVILTDFCIKLKIIGCLVMYLCFAEKDKAKKKHKIQLDSITSADNTCKHIVIFYIDVSTLHCSVMEGDKQGAVFSVIFKMPSVCLTCI